MSIRSIFIFVLFLFLVIISSAQQYHIQRYSIEEGLPRSGVYDVFQDSKGFVWIATEGGGVVRYDGIDAEIYNSENGLGTNTIRCITEDSDKNLWFGAEDYGLVRFDGVNFERFGISNGLTNNTVRDICEDQERNLWVATLGGGVCRKNLDKAEDFFCYTTKDGLPHDKVRAVFSDSRGYVWIGTDGGVSRFDGNEFYNFTVDSGLTHNKVLTIYEDNKGNIWFGTQNGACFFDSKKIIPLKGNEQFVHKRIRAICQDERGNFWFGTKTGASRWNGSVFLHLTEHNGLSNNRIRVISADSNGNLWFGTYFGGVCKFNNDAFITYKKNDGLSSSQIQAVRQKKDGNMMFGSLEGLNILELAKDKVSIKKITVLNKHNGLVSDEITAIYEDTKNRIWVGTNSGLNIIDGKQIKTITKINGLNSNYVTSFYEDDSGQMWIGTVLGINIIEIEGNRLSINKLDSNSDVSKGRITAICSDKNNNVWIGTTCSGIIVLDENREVAGRFHIFSKINSIINDKHKNIWIATKTKGVFMFDRSAENADFKPDANYTKKRGLTSNDVHLMQFDNSFNLWLGGSNGIDELAFDNSGERLLKVRHFGIQEGFGGIETNPNAVFKDYFGRLWFGTLKGVICYDSDNEFSSHREPNTHIVDVRLFFDNINWKETDYTDSISRWFNTPYDLVLPHDKNHLTFDFIGLSYKLPEKIKYRWHLAGIDKEWSPPSKNQAITYSSLPSGSYTFSVKACNADGVWNDIPTNMHFKIKTPYWKTIPFYIFCGFVGTLFIVLIGRLREAKLRRSKRILEQEVARRTKELQEEKEIVQMKSEEILQQTEEIAAQRDELFYINTELETKNQDIVDSLRYANRIQKAIMRSQNQVEKHFPKSFIFYRPKDIVSGDFYWFAKSKDKLYIAAVDCTGHGVPGALMSILGHGTLDQILSEKPNASPAQILKKLHSDIVKAMQKGEDEAFAREGMDIALCKVCFKTRTLEYSGAFRPLILVQPTANEHELVEIKGDRTGIGGVEKNRSFENHVLKFQQGWRFYIYSDGYADQFGGQNDKKFLTKRFKSVLLSLANTPMFEQKNILANIFDEWKGYNNQQIDDVLVLGVEF